MSDRRDWIILALFGALLFWLLWTVYSPCDGPNPPKYCSSCAAPVGYSNGQRAYKVRLGDNEPSMLRADRIERRDGCVLFWRQDRIDTILCEGGVGTLIVTEVYE